MKVLQSDKFRFYVICILLLAGLMLTYSNHFKNSFHFDDTHTIVNNVWIKNINNIPKFFTDGSTLSSLPQNQAYRPGLTTLNAVDYWLATKDPLNIGADTFYIADAGLKPFYFHLSIFLCFILQAILMFLLFKKLLDLTLNHKWNKYFALFIVALYCYHTALAETVNYILSRSDGFSTLMLLLAFVIYIYFPAKRKYQLYLIPYIFGFFVKEPTLMFAPILFVYIALFEKQADLSKIFNKENWKKVWGSFISIFHILVIGGGLYLFSYFMTPKTNVWADISRWDYLITQPFVIVQYFKTFILPTELSADTDWQPLSTIFDIRMFMGIMFIIGMLWLALRLSRNVILRPVSFGIFWFFIALIPTSSFFPLSEMLNDHRVYFPYIGLTLAFAYIFIYLVILKDEKKFISSVARKIITGILIIGILGGFAYGTHQRNKIWHDDESLWYDVVQKSPNNGRGLMNYALSQMQKGNYPTAKTYFEKALKQNPNYSIIYINLGVLHSALNDTTIAEQYFKNAIAIGTYIDQGYYYYGNFLYNRKRYDEAREMLRNCLTTNPAYTNARFTLMALYNETEDWGNLKKLAEETLQYLPNDAKCLTYIDASKDKKTKFDIALEIAKKNPTAENYLNLSLYYYNAGMYIECINACKEAIKIKPDYAPAYNNICTAYNQLKMYDKAIEACNKALKIDPNYELAKNNIKLVRSQTQNK